MYENFEKIMKERGITPYRVAKETGIAQSCLSDWKHRKSMPRVDKLIKIAAYLEVSLEDLVQERGKEYGSGKSKRDK